MNSISLSLSEAYINYKEWVRRNPNTASEVESTIKWISYFIAGKINKSVILTELIYSASNLLVLFNDLIIQSERQKLTSHGGKIKIWLTVLEYSEVFIEISSKKQWGEKGKWIVIICVQLLKCVARLVLLLHFKERLVSCPPILPFKRNQEKLEDSNRTGDGILRINNIAFTLKRSGRVIRKVDSAPPLNSRLWKPPVASNCAGSSSGNNSSSEEELNKTALQQQLIGELLYIVKPVVNLGAIMKYGQSKWAPWIISASMDLLSLYMLSKKAGNHPISADHLTKSQKLEISRRHLALVLYLMRSPFYEKHTKDRINSFLNSISRNIPLAKLICSPIQQYIPFWQETYFYFWSS